MPQERTMIQVKDLTKEYGTKLAVDSISFEVHSGEVLGFLGPNGAGKSTTMKMLTCYLAPTAGSAQLGGHDVMEDSLAVRSLVGYLPENTPLYTDLTTLEMLEFVSSVRGVAGDRKEARLREISGRCGLDEVLDQPVGELSKGYRQRVGLAQAMIHDPPILILDEPTSGLDPNQIVEIRELIKEIGKEKTVILSTHILPEVQATCGRVIIINEGKLVADGSPDELALRDAGNTYQLMVEAEDEAAVRVKLGAVQGVVKISTATGEDGASGWVVQGEAGNDLRRELFTCVRDNDWVLLEMRRHRASLEDVFRKLTRE